MEQAHAGEGHDDAVLVALFDDQVITDGAAGLGDVLDTGSDTTLDGVGEGEEGIGAQSNSITGIQPCPLFFCSEGLRALGENMSSKEKTMENRIYVTDQSGYVKAGLAAPSSVKNQIDF